MFLLPLMPKIGKRGVPAAAPQQFEYVCMNAGWHYNHTGGMCVCIVKHAG